MMNDKCYMELAIALAKATLGQTSPNPCVGALIVKNNQIIASGAHLRSGGDHAEVVAFKSAISNAFGATLYTTLEPCVHTNKKTPPCVDTIIKHGIARVVVATLDQNPQVCGLGVKRLKDAGIRVDVGLCEDAAIELNQIFFHYIKTKTPFVTLKCGMSLDAKLATRNFESKWITSEKSRIDAHRYRHNHDAILVGINTILTDDPILNTRLEGGGRNPKRVILDTNLKTPKTANIIMNTDSPTYLVVGAGVSVDLIAQYEVIPHVSVISMSTPSINLEELLYVLGDYQITSLLVEGGRRVISSFCDAKIYNQLLLYIAPKLIGGVDAPSLFMGEGYASLSEIPQLSYKSVELIGDDLKVVLSRV